jgi:hypothetical protein
VDALVPWSASTVWPTTITAVPTIAATGGAVGTSNATLGTGGVQVESTTYTEHTGSYGTYNFPNGTVTTGSELNNAGAFDAGTTSTTAGLGDVVIIYSFNTDNTTSDGDLGHGSAGGGPQVFGDIRLYAKTFDGTIGGTKVELGSGFDQKGAATSFTGLSATTANNDIVGYPNYSASYVHIFFNEARESNETTTLALRHRVYEVAARGVTGTTIDAQFSPSTKTSDFKKPNEIDNHVQDSPNFAEEVYTYGATVGVYFRQDGHYWYNEWNGAWLTDGLIITPQLIDNEHATNVNAAWTVTGDFAEACTDLSKAISIWTKADPTDGEFRLHVRVHN